MSQSVVKWGNSLAFRIPAVIANELGLDVGAELEFRIEGKRLVIEKATDRFSHKDLVKALGMASKELVELGGPRGREVL
jgi:antitoxin component of MazEF toxin-antitoxin module